jgi:hypothetical protein
MKLLLPFFSLLALFSAFSPLGAQSGSIPPNVAAVGTTITTGGTRWAYLYWRASEPLALAADKIAIYRKNGTATATTSYARVSITEAQTDPAVIGALLHRAEQLGDDLTLLNAAIVASFGPLFTDSGIALEKKIAAVITGAHGDAEKTAVLDTIAASHPALAMARGHAIALEVSVGIHTFELRTFDAGNNRDLDVIGRVQVNTAAVTQLPAPGRPLSVPYHLTPPPATAAAVILPATPRDDALVRLRWATPDPLRDASLMQHGFNLFRVSRTFAEGLNWHLTAPTTTALLAAVSGSPTFVARVNRTPIITERQLTANEAAYDTDQETYFLADDNNRHQASGTPFADGAAYYYFTTARDILGRDGVVSPASPLVTLCDRMPPMPPAAVKVENIFNRIAGARKQRLKVSWTAPADSSGIKDYYLYRWSSIGEMQQKSRDLDPVEKIPDYNLAAIIPHVAGTAQYSFIDDGTTAPPAWANLVTPTPAMPAQEGVGYYYTIRARDNSVCGGNVSKASGTAIGHLHDHTGPTGAPVSSIKTICYTPVATFLNFGQEDELQFSNAVIKLRLSCEAKPAMTPPMKRRLAWAEFYTKMGASAPVLIGRVSFTHPPAGNSKAEILTAIANSTTKPQIGCRIGLNNGAVSPIVYSTNDQLTQITGKRRVLNFEGEVQRQLCIGGDEHDSSENGDEDGDGTVERNNVVIEVTMPAGAAEYRAYRRIDEGDYQLLNHDTTSAGALEAITDDTLPTTPCRVCYYIQVTDSSGNPGPYWLVHCVEVNGTLPTPMLTPLSRQGSSATPQMRVKFFCPPSGVERFEVWIGRQGGGALLSSTSTLSADQATHPNTSIEDSAGTDFGVYDTPHVMILSPAGATSQFSFDVPVELGAEYTVLVRAVGPGGYSVRNSGDFSNAETFSWLSAGSSTDVNVPWPARPAPATGSFHSSISAAYINYPNNMSTTAAQWEGVGVRIGEIPQQAKQVVGENKTNMNILIVDTASEPESYLYSNTATKTAEEGQRTNPGLILPVVMYRTQIPNAKYPSVSGDLVQVTPLMEEIAYKAIGGGSPQIEIHDPYIGLQANGAKHDIMLLDRHPVLTGAAYQYLLVRYGPDKEIERVIPTNTVTTRTLP